MFYSPLIPIPDNLQDRFPKRFQELRIFRIVGDDTLPATRESVGLIVQAIEMDLAVEIALGDPLGRYVLQYISFPQAPVYEEVDTHSFVGGHDLQVPRLLNGSDETLDACNFQLTRLGIVGIVRKRRLQSIYVWVCMISDRPQELCLLCQHCQTFVGDLLAIQEDVEIWVQEGKPEIKRDDFRQEWEAAPYALLDALEMNDRAVLMFASVLAEGGGFPFPKRIILRCQILGYGVVQFGIVDDAPYIGPALHLVDDGDFVRAGQKRKFSDSFPADEWSACR